LTALCLAESSPGCGNLPRHHPHPPDALP